VAGYGSHGAARRPGVSMHGQPVTAAWARPGKAWRGADGKAGMCEVDPVSGKKLDCKYCGCLSSSAPHTPDGKGKCKKCGQGV